MAECIPFPKSFPAHALTTVLKAWRGEGVNIREASNCAWNVLGFVLDKTLPDQEVEGHLNPADPLAPTMEEVEAAFAAAKDCCHEVDGNPVMMTANKAIPWSLIAQVAWFVIKKFLLKDEESD